MDWLIMKGCNPNTVSKIISLLNQLGWITKYNINGEVIAGNSKSCTDLDLYLSAKLSAKKIENYEWLVGEVRNHEKSKKKQPKATVSTTKTTDSAEVYDIVRSYTDWLDGLNTFGIKTARVSKSGLATIVLRNGKRQELFVRRKTK